MSCDIRWPYGQRHMWFGKRENSMLVVTELCLIHVGLTEVEIYCYFLIWHYATKWWVGVPQPQASCAKFNDYRSSRSEEIRYLIYHVTSHDHMINDACARCKVFILQSDIRWSHSQRTHDLLSGKTTTYVAAMPSLLLVLGQMEVRINCFYFAIWNYSTKWLKGHVTW